MFTIYLFLYISLYSFISLNIKIYFYLFHIFDYLIELSGYKKMSNKKYVIM